LHEIYAATQADGTAVAGFALAKVGRLLAQKRYAGNKTAILWARHDLLRTEVGSIYPPGLIEFGIPPSAVTVVRAHGVADVLQAGLDAARCSVLISILVEFWGKARAYDLTASRKLALAAKSSGVAMFLLRHGAAVLPSAAETRWSVRGLPSCPFAANAPGRPAFDITLLRHRRGMAGQSWFVEWNRDTASFEERGDLAGWDHGDPSPAPLSGDLAALSPHRQAAPRPELRKTG
jgi:protein ImuA